MIINEETKAIIEGSAFITLVTLTEEGTPHPIIAGKGEVSGDTVVFGIYAMNTTQKNLLTNNNAWIVAATMEGGPKGCRLIGTAVAKDKKLIFTPNRVEALI